ncbi:hypothetical protein ADUPG1_010365, partial [Aduncisulcus paluster]
MLHLQQQWLEAQNISATKRIDAALSFSHSLFTALDSHTENLTVSIDGIEKDIAYLENNVFLISKPALKLESYLSSYIEKRNRLTVTNLLLKRLSITKELRDFILLPIITWKDLKILVFCSRRLDQMIFEAEIMAHQGWDCATKCLADLYDLRVACACGCVPWIEKTLSTADDDVIGSDIGSFCAGDKLSIFAEIVGWILNITKDQEIHGIVHHPSGSGSSKTLHGLTNRVLQAITNRFCKRIIGSYDEWFCDPEERASLLSSSQQSNVETKKSESEKSTLSGRLKGIWKRGKTIAERFTGSFFKHDIESKNNSPKQEPSHQKIISSHDHSSSLPLASLTSSLSGFFTSFSSALLISQKELACILCMSPSCYIHKIMRMVFESNTQSSSTKDPSVSSSASSIVPDSKEGTKNVDVAGANHFKSDSPPVDKDSADRFGDIDYQTQGHVSTGNPNECSPDKDRANPSAFDKITTSSSSPKLYITPLLQGGRKTPASSPPISYLSLSFLYLSLRSVFRSLCISFIESVCGSVYGHSDDLVLSVLNVMIDVCDTCIQGWLRACDVNIVPLTYSPDLISQIEDEKKKEGGEYRKEEEREKKEEEEEERRDKMSIKTHSMTHSIGSEASDDPLKPIPPFPLNYLPGSTDNLADLDRLVALTHCSRLSMTPTVMSRLLLENRVTKQAESIDLADEL